MRTRLVLLNIYVLLALLLGPVAAHAQSVAETADPAYEQGFTPDGGFRVNEFENERFMQRLDSLMADMHYRTKYASREDSTVLNRYGFSSWETPRYSAEVIDQRMKELCTVVRLDYNPIVQNFIDLYLTRRRAYTSKLLGLQHVYFPMIEEILDREEMPLELKYMVVIESAFNTRAKSWAGATGLWQFMYATGKQFGMRIDSYVDERRDPRKATEKAARFLKSLYNMFGDWQLAIAAYNCGPGNVNKAILRSGGKRDFWSLMPYLPRETRGYVPAFIAVVYGMNYATEHNLYPIWPDIYLPETKITINRQMTLAELAGIVGVDRQLLAQINPELKKDIIPASAKVYVPDQASFLAYAKYVDGHLDTDMNELYASAQRGYGQQPTGNSCLVYHKVTASDSYASIASQYQVREADITAWNQLYVQKKPIPGQTLKLYIPLKKGQTWCPPPADTAFVANKKPDMPPVRTVGGIAKPQSSAVAAPASAKPAIPQYYKVRSGDTLSRIVTRFEGVTLAKVLKLNGLTSRSVLNVGQRIRLY